MPETTANPMAIEGYNAAEAEPRWQKVWDERGIFATPQIRRFAIAGVAAVAALVLASIAMADEGLWTFDNFPAATVKTEYGVTIDRGWLDHVRLATVRLSTGCSASIVSGEGLLLTNHHCVLACVYDLSTAGRDFVDSGYAAATRSQERQCPGMQAEVLIAIGDVTDQVQAAIAGKLGRELIKARDAAVADIEKAACLGQEAVRTCQVVSLYQGGQYKLYTYRKYADVRLVFAPELAAAFFGGDPDNFNFPRYALDAAFLRLYENGEPIAAAQHLRWNPAPPRDGEMVFTVGNPGTTSRLLTADEIDTLRDISIPQTLLQLAELRGRLVEFSARGVEENRIAARDLFGVENSFKAFYGQFQALAQPGFIAAKRRADASLKARVAADPALAARTGDPWAEIAGVQKERAALNARFVLLEARAGSLSHLYSYARRLVRAAQERGKPNNERLPEFTDSRLPRLKKELLDARPVYPELEALALDFWLTKVREYLTVDAPETAIFLGKDSPQHLAARLSASRLGDVKVREALWEGGLPAVEASDDPMIKYVLATDPTARAVRKTYEDKVSGPTVRAAERIAAARFALFGTAIYPDATFTPRLSFGKVSGWSYRGETVPAFTTFAGLWARATGKPPFALAAKWSAAKAALNDRTIFDFVTTNDIVGGNSGSPIIDADGEAIGVVFDGNILSLGGTFAYDGSVNRAIGVSAVAITEALQKVYGQKALVAELLAP